MSLENNVILITGGTGGLGTTVTQTFLNTGATVVVSFRQSEKFEELKSNLDIDTQALQGIEADLLEESSVEAMTDETKQKLGRIDALLNLAGGFLGDVDISDLSEKQWERMMNINLKSTFLCCKHVLPVMISQNSGKIINIGAKVGMQGVAGLAAYGASKAGLINFTQALAEEVKPYNITANVLLPSIIDTPANRKSMPNANFNDWVSTETLANMLLFLVSDQVNDINGAAIPIYGNL